MPRPVRVVVVGAGHMGSSHARAFVAIEGFDLVGIVTRGDSGLRLVEDLGVASHYGTLRQALDEVQPDAVAIASFTESHVPYATQALEADCHVFVEKPIAASLAEAQALIDLASKRSRTLVVGYILQHHPSWQRFIELAQTLGKPLVMRMNLNQQSDGDSWRTHQSILATTSPLVDCGVHYVDVMSQMTRASVQRVHAIGARLGDDIPPGAMNYGQLQVTFDDESVGWYEVGWGPMMSETAFFIKDVVGPHGAISFESGLEPDEGSSSDVGMHTATNQLRRHHSQLDDEGKMNRSDEFVDTSDEPDHDELCRLEQEWFLAAIRGEVTTASHLEGVLQSLRIVLAADESIRTGEVVHLDR